MNFINSGLEILHKGGWVMYPFLVMMTVALAVIIERTISLKRAEASGAALMSQLKSLIKQDKPEEALKLCRNTPGPVAAMLASGIENRERGDASVERIMEEHALESAPELARRLGWLDTIITMAPLLGLLGTITGMIGAFDVVGSGAGQEAANRAITGGVAESLIATATGLVIAIICLPFYNSLNERVRDIIGEMETRGTQLLNLLYSHVSEGHHHHNHAGVHVNLPSQDGGRGTADIASTH